MSVDAEGLHLCSTVPAPREWRCAEVILTESLGYGTYCFETRGLDLPDACMVAGAFTWDGCAPPDHRELDFEFSGWGNAADTCTGQYVVQPCGACTGCGSQCSDHCRRFGVGPEDATSDLTHYLIWQSGSATYRTYRGRHCRGTPPAQDLLHEWTPPPSVAIPTPGVENFRFNLWISQQGACLGQVPTVGHCTVITDFDFVAP